MNAPAPENLIAQQILPVEHIIPSPTNPRTRRNKEADERLAENVKKVGVLQAITVRPIEAAGAEFEVVFGHRRFDAAKAAGLTHISAIVRDLTDVEVMELQLIENHQREDVDELEEAVAFKRLMDLPGDDKKTVDDIAAMIGMSRRHVYDRLSLLDLGPQAREAFISGKISASLALLLARVKGPALQKRATELVLNGYNGDVLSYRAAKLALERQFTITLADAPWNLDDATLCPAAGSCANCIKRSGNDEALQADLGNTNTCTDTACYDEKKAAHYIVMREKFEARGIKIIQGDEAKKLMPYGNFGYDSDYVDLDEQAEDDQDGRTYRQILEQAGVKVETIVVASPSSTARKPLVEGVTETALEAALKKAGWEPAEEEPAAPPAGESAKDKAAREKREQEAAAYKKEREERELKTKIEKTYRAELFQEIRVKAGEEFAASTVFAPATLTAIAVNLFLFYDRNEDSSDLMTMWGHKPASQDHADDFVDVIIGMDTPALCMFMVDLGLITETNVPYYWDEDDEKPERLLAEAQRLGIDAAQIRAEVEEAFAPKQETPAKQPAKAAKKAPTPNPAARAADKANEGAAETKAKSPTRPKAAAKKAVNPAPAKPANETPTEAGAAKAPTKAKKSAPAKPAKEGKTEGAPAPTLNPIAAWPFPTGVR